MEQLHVKYNLKATSNLDNSDDGTKQQHAVYNAHICVGAADI
jgi:hypothetical protein